MEKISLPIPEPKLWVIDIDGVVFIHNSYKNGGDRIVPGFMEFYSQIRPVDQVVLITARMEEFRQCTLEALKVHKIRYDHIIFDVPKGERVLINDDKPGGVQTALAIRTTRDAFPTCEIIRSV